MTFKVVDFWFHHKTQNFKIGDWFYLYGGKTIKLTSQEVINIKLGVKHKLCGLKIIHKINEIDGDRIYFLIKDNIEVIR